MTGNLAAFYASAAAVAAVLLLTTVTAVQSAVEKRRSANARSVLPASALGPALAVISASLVTLAIGRESPVVRLVVAGCVFLQLLAMVVEYKAAVGSADTHQS